MSLGITAARASLLNTLDDPTATQAQRDAALAALHPLQVPTVLPPAPDLHGSLTPDLVGQPVVTSLPPAPVPVPPPSILPPAPDHGMAAPDLLPAAPDLAPSPMQIAATAQVQARQQAQADATSGANLAPAFPTLHATTSDVSALPITVSVPATTMVRNSDGSVSEVPTTPTLAQLHVAQAGTPMGGMSPGAQLDTAATPAMQDAAIVSGPPSPTTAAEAGLASSPLALFLLLGAGLYLVSSRKGRR